ncbi:multicopper oxidase family protein [Neobacillus sp. SM06]|uniref:multicopper oxidase family protein n=1 Tax=Neobacillus sp. SM06 TaxID=3422492 RepID=UPI003D2889DA
MKIKFTILGLFVLVILSACSNNKSSNSMGNMDMGSAEKTSTTNSSSIQATDTKTLTGNEFTLVAKEASLEITDKLKVDAWTFNGSVPGSEIRVKQGTPVKITLKNELPEPTSIHWHGITLPNPMDGIPGVTQDAVQPGKSFTYEFTPTVPGTYMYHTHQDGVKQLDKGLYGAFIVEPAQKTYGKDYTLMLDEWISNPNASMEGMNMGNTNSGSMSGMAGMDNNSNNNSSQTSNNASMMADNMSMYDVYTINGKSGKSIQPINVKKGEKVRLRLLNIGFLPHNIHLHGQSFKVVATDGIDLNQPKEIKDQLITIAPGERYDIEFTANNPGKWYLESHDPDQKAAKGMATYIQYDGATNTTDQSDMNQKLPFFDLENYGIKANGPFTLDQKYDVEYTMNLNTAMNNNQMVYTINDKTFPNTDNIQVKKGDTVKVKLVNKSGAANHPMHLHGHSFQVLSKNGKPVEGSPISKDTINLKPGDEYVVAFKADNPGNWLFHCHDLHHASAGMITMVKYQDYQTTYQPDPNAKNKPE